MTKKSLGGLIRSKTAVVVHALKFSCVQVMPFWGIAGATSLA